MIIFPLVLWIETESCMESNVCFHQSRLSSRLVDILLKDWVTAPSSSAPVPDNWNPRLPSAISRVPSNNLFIRFDTHFEIIYPVIIIRIIEMTIKETIIKIILFFANNIFVMGTCTPIIALILLLKESGAKIIASVFFSCSSCLNSFWIICSFLLIRTVRMSWGTP